MEQFMERLTQLLKLHFPGAELELRSREDGRISGFLLWSGFQERDQIERQREVRKVLRGQLNPEEQHQVAAILTLTPDEMAAAREG